MAAPAPLPARPALELGNAGPKYGPAIAVTASGVEYRAPAGYGPDNDGDGDDPLNPALGDICPGCGK